MAEYKNGVNFRGNMSVEADDISPDIKTGRIVFVDDDLYESDTAYKAKVDKCVEEGFVKSSDVGSGGGGGGSEHLVATYNSTTHVLDKTYGEIAQAIENGGIGSVTIKMKDTEYCTILTFNFADDTLGYSMVVGDGMYMFQEGSETDYPMYVSD